MIPLSGPRVAVGHQQHPSPPILHPQHTHIDHGATAGPRRPPSTLGLAPSPGQHGAERPQAGTRPSVQALLPLQEHLRRRGSAAIGTAARARSADHLERATSRRPKGKSLAIVSHPPPTLVVSSGMSCDTTSAAHAPTCFGQRKSTIRQRGGGGTRGQTGGKQTCRTGTDCHPLSITASPRSLLQRPRHLRLTSDSRRRHHPSRVAVGCAADGSHSHPWGSPA